MSVDIKHLDPATLDATTFTDCFVGCVVRTQDGKILLQQRGEDWKAYPGYMCEFGGHIEEGEMPMQALVRELHEELGARVLEKDVIALGAVTERSSGFKELVYVFFWCDREGTITGCYEGEPRFYDDVEAALRHPKMMESVKWLLRECHRLGYI